MYLLSQLFLNFKTIEENNENNLIENLSSNLSINRSSIRCEIKGNQVKIKKIGLTDTLVAC